MQLRFQTMTQHLSSSCVQQLVISINRSHKRNLSIDKKNHQGIHSERRFSLNTQNDKFTSKDSLINLLKNQVSFKIPWKGSSLKHEQDALKRLSHKHEMDSCFRSDPMNIQKVIKGLKIAYKGIKIPEKGRQFNPITQKDKHGHLPYLYQNDIRKYESLKQKLSVTPFKVTNSVRHDIFGFGKKKYLKQRPCNHSQLLQNKKRSYQLSLL